MTQQNDSFPFALEDIKAWIVKRKDGTTIRYNVIRPEEARRQDEARNSPGSTFFQKPTKPVVQGFHHYSAWCKHEPDPAGDPIFEKDGIRLFIADAVGARACHHKFDVAIDGGGVLAVPGEYDLPTLYGDPGLKSMLASHIRPIPRYTSKEGAVRILKIRWDDRAAPPVLPTFWPALLEELKVAAGKKGSPLNVLTICQGGHGRSGTALASLIMCLTDYTPLDVLTHIRALHCARAIESKEQHVYLNTLAELLKRDPDALDAEGVASFKDRFLGLTNEFAVPYQDRVRNGKGATVSDRSGSFL